MSADTRSKGRIDEHGPFISVTGYQDSLDLWDALAAYYLSRRPVRMTTTIAPRAYPETTVGDVHMVAGLFTERLQKARPDALGLPAARKQWLAYQPEMQRVAHGKLLHEVFPDNARFWRETRDLAVYLSTSYTLPTKTNVVLEAIKAAHVVEPSTAYTILEAAGDFFDGIGTTAGHILDRNAEIAERVVGGAEGAIKSVGRGAKGVVQETVSLIGKPLLIGAAVLGGLIIIPKLLDSGRAG